MNVPFLDVRAGNVECESDIAAAIARVIDSGQYILGPELQSFEDHFAAYVGARNCVGVANGHDALYLSLRALDIGPGDEVIVPSFTFSATWLAVRLAGATPVAVDVDRRTATVDPSRIIEVISSRSKAIIPVHLYGCPAELDQIDQIANDHGLVVLEDAAQAHGARYKGLRIGGHGNVAAWSFYPAKNLGALGDGGAITTDDDDIAARLRILRNYGSGVQYHHTELGTNSRLDEIQAAILSVKLARLEDWNRSRSNVALKYLEGLSHTELTLPEPPEWVTPSWHLFVVQVSRRDWIRNRLQELGITTHVHYPIPAHRQLAFESEESARAALPMTDRLGASVLSLPIGPHLTQEQVEHVIFGLTKAIEE